ncbi:hypothetical protein CBS63078_1329 [Aspergillus niger]|nr:hypothetical protein CBS133816_2295 [Aspergillus niger]KAI2860820.1 hypothetical protein CBS12448_5098 [Aspergillus niger]KAI2892137.1 hypothetical protein CBS13152_4949 [Aspergillus niger]KAI2927490.1 hypothetical protein CBS147320_5080 [Aspergillus niger]KAI2932559.1 hypothetical protein CBS63078_1329 [Aspergillus niger]
MWSKSIPAQTGIAWITLLLASGTSAAAVPISQAEQVSVTPSFVADLAANTHISTTTADGKEISVPVVGGPECWFCPEDDQNKTTGGWALLGITGAGTYRPNAVSEFSESVPIITVSEDGDPTYVPSKTASDAPTEVKRASTPTMTHETYKVLEEALKATPVVGDGYALKLTDCNSSTSSESVLTKILGYNWPDHYLLVTGYVTKELGETGSYDLKFEANCFDIARRGEDGKEIYFNKRCGDASTDWYKREKPSEYEVLGKIKKGVTKEKIDEYGEEIAKEMNKKGYNTYTNNCRDFVKKLYAKIKA